jgi:hypothetical protein
MDVLQPLLQVAARWRRCLLREYAVRRAHNQRNCHARADDGHKTISPLGSRRTDSTASPKSID